MSDPSQNISSSTKYKGVRKRKWGKWVSEIRLPNSRDRIWLGSYDSPEKAARAFDAGSFLLRGHRANLNFPDRTHEISVHCGYRNPTPQQIQTAAARYAHAESSAPSLPPPQATEGLATTPMMEHSQLMELTFPLIDEFSYDTLYQDEELEQMDLHVETGSSYLWNF